MATIYRTKETHTKRTKDGPAEATGPMRSELSQSLPLMTRRQRRELYRKAMKEEREKQKGAAK